MLDIVPFVLEQEQVQIKKEIAGNPLSIIFDGTSELWEAIAIAVRFIDSERSIQQQLIQFEVLAKSLWVCSSVDQHLVSTVQHTFQIACSCNVWLCLIQQHCHVALKIVYPSVFIHYTLCTHQVRLLAIALKHGLCGKSKQVNPYVGIPLHNGGAVHGKQWISGRSYLETWSLSLKALDACVTVYQLENKLFACSMFAGYNPLYQLTLQWPSPCLLYQWGAWRGHSKHPACPKTQHCWLNRMIRISRFTSTIDWQRLCQHENRM